MEEEFVIKELIGKKGFYCAVSITLEPIDKRGLNLQYNPQAEWYAAVLFASESFTRESPRPKGGGLTGI